VAISDAEAETPRNIQGTATPTTFGCRYDKSLRRCGVQPKTEHFLNLLLWSAGQLAQPTFRNLSGSYESWAYRHGLLRQLATLEKRQLVERNGAAPTDRGYRLTARGRLHALGGRDPQARWLREWDGRWRLVLFDVATTENTHRARLRRYLLNHGFGCLQHSVWITPDPMEEERQLLGGGSIGVKRLMLFEARPCAGETAAEIVAGAWNFERINRRYSKHLKILERRPTGDLENEASAKVLQRWFEAERKAWLSAATADPLLPERLLPSDYLGKQAWQRRNAVLREAGRQMQTFGKV
jgi:DNA-binding transcriptional regulator PaaX